LNYVILVGLAVGSGCAGVDYARQFIFALWWVIVDIWPVGRGVTSVCKS